MRFCENVKVVTYKNRVIVCNGDNGEWIKLSQECYVLIKDAIENELTEQEFLNEFYDEERKYVKKLLHIMENLKIIYTSQEEIDIEQIETITIAITSQCNLYCRHCYLEAGKKETPPDTHVIKKRLEKIVDCNPKNIVITGGEPLFFNEWKDVVEWLRKSYVGNLILQTNGTLIDSENGKFIAENFVGVEVSLDGFDENSCAKIRGAGVFGLVKQGIEILKAYGMKNISLSMTVTSYSYDNKERFMKLCETWGVKGILRIFAPVGRGEVNCQELLEIRHLAEHKIPYYNSKGINSSADFGLTAPVCSALKRKIYIGADGYIYPCGALFMKEFRIGNIDRMKNILEFLQEKKYHVCQGYKNFIRIFPENLTSCEKCPVCIFCISCPLYLYIFSKNGLLKKYCEKVKGINERNLWGN